MGGLRLRETLSCWKFTWGMLKGERWRCMVLVPLTGLLAAKSQTWSRRLTWGRWSRSLGKDWRSSWNNLQSTSRQWRVSLQAWSPLVFLSTDTFSLLLTPLKLPLVCFPIELFEENDFKSVINYLLCLKRWITSDDVI